MVQHAAACGAVLLTLAVFVYAESVGCDCTPKPLFFVYYAFVLVRRRCRHCRVPIEPSKVDRYVAASVAASVAARTRIPLSFALSFTNVAIVVARPRQELCYSGSRSVWIGIRSRSQRV